MTKLLEAFLTHLTYLALVLILVIAGLGAPIPEDIPLAFSGSLCHPKHSSILNLDGNGDGQPDQDHTRVPNFYLMILSGMVGVLAGDSIIFVIGRRGIDTNNFVARHIRTVLHSKRRERAERYFHKYGSLTVFAGRFMPGLRSLVFAMAGMSKMAYWRFMVIDGLAAAISVPTFVWLGYHFAGRIAWLIQQIDHYKPIIAGAVAIVALTGVLIYLVRRRRARMAAMALERV